MSRELRLSYNAASATLYAIVRRASDDAAWNGSAFETWANANIATYKIALTDAGGDSYEGDFPTSIVAGNYLILYYEQAGGSPAITDLLLTTDSRYWDGAALSSSSSISLSSYALTTLDNQKRYLRITDSDDDTLVTQLINAVSAEIERVCGVQFAARDRRERYNGIGQQRLTLKQFPVLDLRRLSWGNSPALTVTYSGAAAVRAEVGVSDTSVRISSVASTGTVTTNNLLFTDYDSVSDVVTAINLISGWTATTNHNTASADLNPQGGTDAKSKTVILGYPDRGDMLYSVDYAAGSIELTQGGWNFYGGNVQRYGGRTGYEGRSIFPSEAAQYILVQYRAGYETIPADVELMCNQFVADVYNNTFVSRRVSLVNLGPFTWKASKDQAVTIRDELAAYIDLSKCMGAA